ncbi:MAG: hypothetical protein ACXW6R_21010 [Candidatus Binatia bacterium]
MFVQQWVSGRFALCVIAVATLIVGGAGHPAQAAKDQPTLAAGECPAIEGFAVLATPSAPWKGAPLRVIVVAEEPIEGDLELHAPDGAVAARAPGRRGGPPYFWMADVAEPIAGAWQAKLNLAVEKANCKALVHSVTVRRAAAGGPGASAKSVWPIRAAWNRETENLYSAWIEALFDAPIDASPSWAALHEVLRDPARNVLFNHLGVGEDERGLVIKPDCADLPYFLRGYFSFKLGLPFGYSKCTRGSKGKPPQCVSWWTIENLEPPPKSEDAPAQTGVFDGLFGSTPEKPKAKPPGLVPGFGTYLSETVANAVHSGSGRPPASADNTDYYSVPLTEAALRPGTVYHDPYGHILVVVRRVPQTTDAAGLILAVDGQPDGTVARKRFWRGNFLFAQNPALGSPGFKRFRPIVRGKSGLRRLTNADIAKSADYGDFSLEQTKLGVEDFYDRMDDVMSPAPLDPVRAMTEVITALDEQVKARVTSVENGRKYHAKGGGEVAMPSGPSIFETTGAWEDFATPSRDLRLLIAIDVVRGFPDRVARRPERYAMPAGKTAADVKAELDRTLAGELASRKFSYTRSDGSEWTLALSDVVARAPELELAYNINDCVELRWGAPEGSTEAQTCQRRAPEAQRSKMASDYRPWFSERRRPPRG